MKPLSFTAFIFLAFCTLTEAKKFDTGVSVSDEVFSKMDNSSMPLTEEPNNEKTTQLMDTHQTTSPPKDKIRCPAKCTCSDDVVDCKKAGKTEIPSANEMPINTRVIDLSYNLIERLSKFDHSPNLTKLILRKNSIEDIEPEVFQSSTGLKELDLSSNEKIKLPINLLAPLHKLESLKLTDCNISKLHVDFFRENVHLTHLSMDMNPLMRLDKNFFRYLKELQFLDLTSTKLSQIEIGREYPMSNLKKLDLSWNQLNFVPIFKYASNIETLILNYNEIGVINQDSFIELKNLRTLQLSHNDYLLDIEELTFAQQTKLQKLVISNNNHLFMISPHAFYGMYNETYFPLKELNLQANSLHFISEDLLTGHWDKLDGLDLRMNPLNCDCHLNWLHKYKRNKNISEVKCALPEKLRTLHLGQIEPESMVCVKLIDALLYEKLKMVIQGFILLLIFLVFTLAFLLIYVVRDRQYGWMRLFGSPSSSTIYYQKANTKEQMLM